MVSSALRFCGLTLLDELVSAAGLVRPAALIIVAHCAHGSISFMGPIRQEEQTADVDAMTKECVGTDR